MAIIVHTVMNDSWQVWNAIREYSGGRLSMSAADTATATVHINYTVAIALWVGPSARCSSTGRATSRVIRDKS